MEHQPASRNDGAQQGSEHETTTPYNGRWSTPHVDYPHNDEATTTRTLRRGCHVKDDTKTTTTR